jgi:hypothetical protein
VSDERRRLYIDAETSYIRLWVWQLNSKSNAHIPHTHILPGGEPKIICLCWKWAGKKKIHELHWDARQNDKAMLKKFVTVLDSADEIVAHNLDAFDIKVIRGRCLLNRVPMLPNYPTVDTLKQMRAKFRLPSNRLDYAGEELIGEGKRKAGQALWENIIERKCEKSMRAMIRYCKTDVKILEGVADRIRPYCEPKTSIADFPRDCPECGGYCTKHQTRTRAKGNIAYSLICTSCGGSHTVTKAAYDRNKRFDKDKAAA